MIKFWKSAARGKSGCPVRPPEPHPSTDNTHLKSLIYTQIRDSISEDCSHIFDKKSKLSLTLRDVLNNKNALKYFIQFMEVIRQHFLVKCWLELEEFESLVANNIHNDPVTNNSNHSKISRAKSFDLQHKCYHGASKRLSWRETSEIIFSAGDSKLSKNDIATSSCGNLAEQASSNDCEHCLNKNLSSPTEEAINLFKKYVALEAPVRLELPDTLRKSVISNICHPEGHIKVDCFRSVKDEVFSQIEKKYFNDFLNSPFYIKTQIDILTNGCLDLKDILYNETILFYFTEYIEQESCSVLLEFLMAVMHFRENVLNSMSNTDKDQFQADAIVLYEKYFSLQATNPVGFPTDIRLKIESDICAEGGIQATCFDVPYKIVFKTLSMYVKSFLESEIYYKYLSEMVHSVDQTWSNQKSSSDCSSEFSISTQNTLLAMGDPVYRKKKRNLSVPDMTIDSNQLYNADALWQRSKHDGLSLGRVNSLGRFESKFEPDPDKKNRSVLKKMVSKFVPSTTCKVEEEMAWQIAHMIVKDVTDLTMAPPETDIDE